MSAILAIIDADSLCFQSSRDSLIESLETLNEKIQNIFTQTKCTHYVMFLTMGDSFRKKLYPEYKANRKKYTTPLRWIKTLKSYLIENYNAQWMEGCEADDLVTFLYNQNICITTDGKLDTKSGWDSVNCILSEDGVAPIEYFPVTKILSSPDKDLLQNIEGKHFNYSYKLEVKDDPSSVIKGWWVETTFEEANRYRLYQYLIGDPGDNVKTPFPENAGKWFTENKMNFEDLVKAYILGFAYKTPTGQSKFVKGLGTVRGMYELSRNIRLLHMLNCEEDFIREVGELPMFPTITALNIQQEEIPNF